MRKILRILIPILMVVILIVSACWYLLVFDLATLQELMLRSARYCTEKGNFTTAAWFYEQAYNYSNQSGKIAIELANGYIADDNFTKAEFTLSNAISDGPSADLYIALCNTYMMQGKLLDAANMLDKISDSTIKAQLTAMRPQIPVASPEPGFYSQYISVTFEYSGGQLLYTTDGTYPSLTSQIYQGPISLPQGENLIYAVVVGDNGLVSPVAIFGYTIGGIIEPVTFADSAVEAAVRDALGIGSNETVYTNDMWDLTSFNMPAEAVLYDDLRYMTYLRELYIEGGTFPGAEILSSLQQLETVSIRGCTLSANDLKIIASLPKLRSLTLSGCGISSIEKLSGATGLTVLDLSNNSLQNIAPLVNMSLLEYLDLSQNAVDSLETLSKLKGLKKLEVSNNSVTSLAPLGGLVKLEYLDLNHNQLTTLETVELLGSLIYLDASYNAITQLDPLADCDTIQELNVSHNQLTSVDAIASMGDLMYLNFAYNSVTALPKLKTSHPLVTLRGDYNQISDISSLFGLKNINNIYLDYNNITKVSGLTKCPNIIQVHVYGNKVPNSQVRPLLDMSIIVQYDPTQD